MKMDVLAPVGMALICVVALVVVGVPMINEKLADPPKAGSTSGRQSGIGAVSERQLIRQAASFQQRACVCADSACVDLVLESMALWGRQHHAEELEATTAATIRASLTAGLACARAQLATKSPADGKPAAP